MEGKSEHKHTRVRRRTRTVISMGLCLMMTAAAALMLSAAAMMAGFGNQDLFLESVSSMQYYEELAEDFTKSVAGQLTQSALPSELADGIVDADEIYIEGTRYIKNVLEGGEPVLDASKVQKKLKKKINNYLSDYEIPENETLDAQVETLLANAAGEYEKKMTFHAAELYRRQHTKLHTNARRILLMCAACIVVPAGILWFLYYRRYHALRYLDYAVLGGTITAGIIHVYTSRRLQSMQALMEGDGYSRIMGQFFREASIKGWFFILTGICVWLALLLVTKELREKKM